MPASSQRSISSSSLQGSSTKGGRHGPSKLSKVSRLSSQSPPRKKLKPLTAYSKAPIYDLTLDDEDTPASSDKGKAKDTRQDALSDHRLWVDKFSPADTDALAVHKKKIEEVRRWMLESISDRTRKYRRILALTGPAGSGKTAVIRALSQELGWDILEWQNSHEGLNSTATMDLDDDENMHVDWPETLTAKFLNFFTRASSCASLFTPTSTSPTSGRSSSESPASTRKHLVLLEDIPNVLHPRVQESVQDAFRTFVETSSESASPCVIVVSDTGLRGESEDGAANSGRGKEVMDIRTIMPSDLLKGPFVTEVRFNPVAPTFMRRALEAMLDSAGSSHSHISRPPKEVLDAVVQASQGDIRSAINALELVCSGSSDTKPSKGRKKTTSRAMLEIVTRKENSLMLFHLLGKVLYNKRKGDPPSTKATKTDVQREKDLDSALRDQPSLPSHLKDHERRTLREDIDTLYSSSPIDSSLFSLYIHQNYPPYCDSLDQCAGVAESLSWIDANGPELWMQANPHRFHIVALGTMHSLPSPVTRRGQKQFKPAFFEGLKMEREAVDAVRQVQEWLQDMDEPTRAGGWNKTRIVLDLPGVLVGRVDTPPTHALFTRFASDHVRVEEINEHVEAAEMEEDEQESHPVSQQQAVDMPEELDAVEGGELDGDEIQDF